MTDICETIRQHFGFLESDYGCKQESSRDDRWSAEVTYRNATTGVKVIWETRSQFVFVEICKLANGEWTRNPSPLTSDSQISCFELQDVLPEGERMRPPYEYGMEGPYHDADGGLSTYIREFALRLRHQGDDFLRGDFSILPRMAEIIKQRAAAQR